MFFLSVKVIESAFSRDIYSVVGLVVWILMLGLVGTSKFSIEDLRVWGEVGLAIVIVSFALAFFGGSGWMSDTSYVVGQGKDGLLSERLLAGPFNHSNQLGIIVAITLPFVAFWKYGPKLKIVALMLMGAALLMSASRSSALVLVLVVGFALVLLAVRKIFSISFGNFVIGSALSGAVALIVLIPYFGLPDEFATGRGIIWRVSTEVALSSFSFPASPELLQPDGWVSLAIGYAPSHSHNSTLTALIVGGWAFFAINVAVLITAMHRAVAVASFSTIPALSVLTLLGLSAVETVWRLDSLSQSTGLAALIVLTMTSIYESTTHKEDSLPVKKSLAIPKNRFPGSRRI
ncbi:hypothetical protein [Pseudoclavibacter helvolus]|uniref:hypothetical protein n=1 Tax=Pseudoclavibacter helvolus TaxID=255205 RepID=UPI0012E84141|nr:hypothetical protein [Pseudoclavibacter helvolus]